MELIEALKWRHASKHMSGKPVSEEKIEIILEAARLAPTSMGLQPFEILVITDPEIKAGIRAIANNQQVVEGASHLLVFAAWDNYTEERINGFVDLLEKVRGASASTETMRKRLSASLAGRSPEVNFVHTARQAYIAFGMAIAAAATLEVDATPMEGFNNEALDDFLKLKERGLKSVTLLALGYRTPGEDWNAGQEKVRRDVVTGTF